MLTVFITTAILIAGGILGASGFVVAKKPNAQELINKLVPYQGWIGIILFIWGVWGVFGLIGALPWLSVFPIYWIIYLLVVVVELGLGFILGYGLIAKYALANNEAAAKKGEETLAKLVKFQIPLGFLGIALGLLYIISWIMYF